MILHTKNTINRIKISIIIINYNTAKYTLNTIKSFFNDLNQDSDEIIVFDNASIDGSAKALRDTFGDTIHFIPSTANIGFAAGNNLAVKHSTGEYLLLLNPDTVVLDQAIYKLVAFAKMHPEAGIWGGRTLFPDLSLNPASCWHRQTLWSLLCQASGLSSLFRKSSFFNMEGMGGWDRQGVREVDIVSGCFILIRRSLWDQLEGFHPDFFMYGEEADLCLRAKQVGARPMVTSEATIIHYGGASETVRSDKLVKLIKAKMTLIRRHFSPITILPGIVLLACWPLSRYFAHSIASLLGRSASTQAQQVWGEVWQQRKKWLVK
jgi:GT2 family glycosyltransferase